MVSSKLVFHNGVQPPAPDAAHRVRDWQLVQCLLVERALRRDFENPFEATRQSDVVERAEMLFSILQASSALRFLFAPSSHGWSFHIQVEGAIGLVETSTKHVRKHAQASHVVQ